MAMYQVLGSLGRVSKEHQMSYYQKDVGNNALPPV